MRIVIDTNVWVSALAFGGNPASVLERVVEQEITIIVSEDILSEIRRVIHDKFPTFVPKFENLLTGFKPLLRYIKLGTMNIDAVRDPKDNMVLETALVSSAKYIISGDRDLLSVQKFRGVQIVSPADFLTNFPDRIKI